MALPWLEGEVFFLRNALVEPRYNFNPNDAKNFYGHMLIEHAWNRWTISTNTNPDFDEIRRRPHPRSTLQIGRADRWGTYFGHFPHWWINFGNDRRGRNITRTFNAEPNPNRNEMRDLDAGGPARVVLRPVPLGTEEFVFIDMTQPIRAVYFPIAHQTEESLPDLCTYLMVDFRLRREISLQHAVVGGGLFIRTDHTWGLGYHVHHTLAIHIPSLIQSISWPRQMRGENANLYQPIPPEQATIFHVWDADIAPPRSHTMTRFHREIDLVRIISAHQGIDITYPPFRFRNFIADALRQIISFGLGFVPGVGTLLTISFNVAFVLITEPDRFRDEFGPSLGFDITAGLIEAAPSFRRRTFLPTTNLPLIIKDEWGFDDRVPPPTSPRNSAGPPSDEPPPGYKGDATEVDTHFVEAANEQPLIPQSDAANDDSTMKATDFFEEANGGGDAVDLSDAIAKRNNAVKDDPAKVTDHPGEASGGEGGVDLEAAAAIRKRRREEEEKKTREEEGEKNHDKDT